MQITFIDVMGFCSAKWIMRFPGAMLGKQETEHLTVKSGDFITHLNISFMNHSTGM